MHFSQSFSPLVQRCEHGYLLRGHRRVALVRGAVPVVQGANVWLVYDPWGHEKAVRFVAEINVWGANFDHWILLDYRIIPNSMICERLWVIHILIEFHFLKLLTCVKYLTWLNLLLVAVLNTFFNLILSHMPLKVIAIKIFGWQLLDIIHWLVALVNLMSWELSRVEELHLVVYLWENRHALLDLRSFWVMVLVLFEA